MHLLDAVDRERVVVVDRVALECAPVTPAGRNVLDPTRVSEAVPVEVLPGKQGVVTGRLEMCRKSGLFRSQPPAICVASRLLLISHRPRVVRVLASEHGGSARAADWGGDEGVGERGACEHRRQMVKRSCLASCISGGYSMAGLVVAAAAVKEEFHWETCGANEKAARQEEKVGSGRTFATWERKRNIFARTKRGAKDDLLSQEHCCNQVRTFACSPPAKNARNVLIWTTWDDETSYLRRRPH
jgi:hypothetical protein